MSLKKQVALVTGGGRAIGRCIALRLAREGVDLCLVGRERAVLEATAEEIRGLGAWSEAAVADVRDEEQVRAAVALAVKRLGSIDILVNNAGVIGPTAPVGEIRLEDCNEVLSVNLTGALLFSKAVAPHMIEQRRGRIINISSIAGKIAYPLRAPYAVSKWGLIGLTMTLASELGPHNITANALCPGPVEGARMQEVIQRRARESDRSIEEVTNEYISRTSLGRMVTEEEVAATVVFLAGESGAGITGQAIDVAAGYGL